MKPKDRIEAQKILKKDAEEKIKVFSDRLKLLQKEFGVSLSIHVQLEQKGDVIVINKKLVVNVL